MKIAFLGEVLSVNSASWIDELKRQGHDVHTWTLSIHKKDSVAKKSSFIKDIFKLKKWLKNLNPDVAIAYRTTSYGFAAALSGFKPYVVVAQGESDAWPFGTFAGKVKQWLGTVAVTNAALAQAWSENMVDGLLQMKAKRSKILVMPRGIDLAKFPYNPAPIEGKTVRAIVTRKLYPEYHIGEVIQAVASINNHAENDVTIKLSIAGDGILREYLHELCSDLKQNEHITFLGKVSNDDLKKHFRESHLYVSVPETEGASASLFEACAAGLFPIVSNVNANLVWLEHGKNGLLSEVGSVEGLAENILRVAKDRELFERGVKYNREMAVEKFSIRKNVAAFIEEYKKLT